MAVVPKIEVRLRADVATAALQEIRVLAADSLLAKDMYRAADYSLKIWLAAENALKQCQAGDTPDDGTRHQL